MIGIRAAAVAAAAALAMTVGCTADDSGDAAVPGATGSPAATAEVQDPEATESATPSGEAQPSTDGQGGAGFPVALCEMNSERWATVVDTGQPAEAQDDALRDGISLLEDRLSQWRSAAAGDPAAADAVELAASVSQDWRAALTAIDEGDPQAADAALASSQVTIDELDDALETLGSQGCE